ncbi:caspase, EACC1-associated type [Dactylosporangium sp. CA-233914]|uniref:caspase, EACC1-associated type n=1 Tax=Dactylosporangium sp. CA-233914 TaxID=3239934 RepID=UPI003D8DB420
MTHRALLIGNGRFPMDQANLPELYGPRNDVVQVAQVLTGASGIFEPAQVTTVVDRPARELVEALERFFSAARHDDVLLVYYSGHGMTSLTGEALFLAGHDSRTDLPVSTMVSSTQISAMIDASVVRNVVLVLDCCYSGAFKSGDGAGPLAGRGRYVLTSSRARQRSPDAAEQDGLSLFTSYLVKGLGTEIAGAPQTGDITVGDLYQYVHGELTRAATIIPQRRFDGDGDVVIARRLTRPAPAITETELIDLGTLEPGDSLPPERLYAQIPAGKWRAETLAEWVDLRPGDTFVELRFRPEPGANRATIEIHDLRSGDVRMVRYLVRLNSTRPRPESPLNRIGTPRGVADEIRRILMSLRRGLPDRTVIGLVCADGLPCAMFDDRLREEDVERFSAATATLLSTAGGLASILDGRRSASASVRFTAGTVVLHPVRDELLLCAFVPAGRSHEFDRQLIAGAAANLAVLGPIDAADLRDRLYPGGHGNWGAVTYATEGTS